MSAVLSIALLTTVTGAFIGALLTAIGVTEARDYRNLDSFEEDGIWQNMVNEAINESIADAIAENMNMIDVVDAVMADIYSEAITETIDIAALRRIQAVTYYPEDTDKSTAILPCPIRVHFPSKVA